MKQKLETAKRDLAAGEAVESNGDSLPPPACSHQTACHRCCLLLIRLPVTAAAFSSSDCLSPLLHSPHQTACHRCCLLLIRHARFCCEQPSVTVLWHADGTDPTLGLVDQLGVAAKEREQLQDQAQKSAGALLHLALSLLPLCCLSFLLLFTGNPNQEHLLRTTVAVCSGSIRHQRWRRSVKAKAKGCTTPCFTLKSQKKI